MRFLAGIATGAILIGSAFWIEDSRQKDVEPINQGCTADIISRYTQAGFATGQQDTKWGWEK